VSYANKCKKRLKPVYFMCLSSLFLLHSSFPLHLEINRKTCSLILTKSYIHSRREEN